MLVETRAGVERTQRVHDAQHECNERWWCSGITGPCHGPNPSSNLGQRTSPTYYDASDFCVARSRELLCAERRDLKERSRSPGAQRSEHPRNVFAWFKSRPAHYHFFPPRVSSRAFGSLREPLGAKNLGKKGRSLLSVVTGEPRSLRSRGC